MFKATAFVTSDQRKTYSDPALFEADMKALGKKKSNGTANGTFARSIRKPWSTPSRKAFAPVAYDLGSEVTFHIDGETIVGQVWSRTYKPNTVFVVANGVAYVVNTKTNGVYVDMHDGRQPAIECVGYYSPVAYAAA